MIDFEAYARNSPDGKVHVMDGKCRVVICEDNSLLAETLSDTLDRFGCNVVACAVDIESAVSVAQSIDVDIAIVAWDLQGALAYPILDVLTDRGIPFIISTDDNVVDIYGRVPLVTKPYASSELFQAISEIGLTMGSAI